MSAGDTLAEALKEGDLNLYKVVWLNGRQNLINGGIMCQYQSQEERRSNRDLPYLFDLSEEEKLFGTIYNRPHP